MGKEFPKGFLWGASTSAYQVEGAAYEDGKKASQQDIINQDSFEKFGFATAEVASDQYHHFREDIALMKEMGFNTYRFSIAWSRVFPDGDGPANEKGIRYYRNLIDELLNNGMEPIVTLYHYDLPWALVERYGGWLDRRVVKDFEYQINHHMNLAQAIANKLVHELVPGGLAGAPLGYSPIYPLTSDPKDVMAMQNAQALRNDYYTDVYFKGHYNKAAQIYLEEHGLAPVMEEGDLELLADPKAISDFLALNNYASECAKWCEAGEKEIQWSGVNRSGKKGEISGFETHPGFYEMCANPRLDTTDWDWAIDPQGMEYMLRDLYNRYNKPLMITENGLGVYDTLTEDGKVHDDYRIDFLRENIKAIKRAIDKGVEVLAYCPWSAVDVLSTSNGVKKRYGLIYVDRTDSDARQCARIRKDSFYWYQKVIGSNGAELD